ncbi:MAG: hypothetical protein AAGJ35_12340, partial [Myxococcota bacterium]
LMMELNEQYRVLVPKKEKPRRASPHKSVVEVVPKQERHVTWMREKIVRIARRSFGKRRMHCAGGLRMRRDCSGWVRCVFSYLHVDTMKPPDFREANGVLLMKRFVEAYGQFRKKGRPLLGDLVFWHYTYDKNGNRVLDDPWTHIGIVERIEDNGRIAILHYTNRVRRVYMFLKNHDLRYIQKTRWVRPKKLPNSCLFLQERVRACRAERSRKQCLWLRKRVHRSCPMRQAKHKIEMNSLLVKTHKRGRIHGRLTGELFGGFGTVLHVQMPTYVFRKNARWVSSAH